MTVRPDYSICTMADVIAYAAAHHAEPFWSRAEDMRRVHAHNSFTMRDYYARWAANRMAVQLDRAASAIINGKLDVGALSFGERVMLFGIAARMLDIPRRVQAEIAGRSYAR